MTGPDWSASQVIQPVVLSARKDGNGASEHFPNYNFIIQVFLNMYVFYELDVSG